MRYTIALFAALMPLAIPAIASAQNAPATSTPALAPAKYDVESTTIGELLEDPVAKAVLEKHIKEIVDNPQIDGARGMTLKAVQPYAADLITDEKLAAIQAGLQALPAKK